MICEPFHIDGFAGGGGASEGYYLATGRHTDVACNHDREATAMHRANHPFTEHHCEDIRKVVWRGISRGKVVTSAWFSPDCKDFSKAKGGKPKSKRIRGLAWTIIHMINQLGPLVPLVIFMENVEEFAEWCPLLPDGTRNKQLLAWFFQCFVGALRRRGYVVEWRELRACEHSRAPTIRKRLYLIARRDGQAITWPEHAFGEGKANRQGIAADILDLTLPCPSIFMTRRQARTYTNKTGIKIQRPLARASLKRFADGVKRYVMDAKEPFFVLVNNTRNTGSGAAEPTKTVASGGNHALAMPFLARQQHGGGSSPLAAPTRTIAASAKDQNQLVAVHLAKLRGAPETHPGSKAATEPLGAISAGGGHHGVAAITLAQLGYGERKGQRPRSLDVQKPLGTAVGGGIKHGIATVFLAQNNGGMVGHDAREPVSTVAARGSNQALVALGYAKYYGNEKEGQTVGAPIGTVTTKERFGVFEAELMAPPLTPELAKQARRVARFLRRHGVKVDGEFAMCGELVIVDIGMRMLTARELYRAQGFADDYIIDRGFLEDGTEIRLSKTAQVKMCGNSVCPPMAEILFRLNLPKEHLMKEAA